MVQDQYVYLFANLPLLIIWAILYFARKDLRKEMWFMSLLVGLLSLATGYYYWTVDWWGPITITGTRVGIEDFMLGFSTGGIMAVIYEELFKKRFYKRKVSQHYPGGFTILLLLAQLTSFLFWGVKITSFGASTVAMLVTGLVMLYFRKDLFFNAIISGILMMLIASLFYITANLASPGWLGEYFFFDNLSGLKVGGAPLEEYVFWFLGGFVFGPFYEYWQGQRLRKMSGKV